MSSAAVGTELLPDRKGGSNWLPLEACDFRVAFKTRDWTVVSRTRNIALAVAESSAMATLDTRSVSAHLTRRHSASALNGQEEIDMDGLSTCIGTGRQPDPADFACTRTRRPRLSTWRAEPATDRNVTAFERQSARIALRGVAMALALAGLFGSADLMASRGVEPSGREAYDPLLSEPAGNVCAPAVAGRPPLLQKLILAQAGTKSETKPFTGTSFSVKRYWFSSSMPRCEVRLSDEQAALVKRMNEEQTASLQTALLHAARDARVVRTQMRTAQRGSIPITWTSTSRATKG